VLCVEFSSLPSVGSVDHIPAVSSILVYILTVLGIMLEVGSFLLVSEEDLLK
jgi:hypothetical protein